MGDKKIKSSSEVNLPTLQKAYLLGQEASEVGFDWGSTKEVIEKLKEEIAEYEGVVEGGDYQKMEEELGDILLCAINLGRFSGINPEEALRKAISRWISRFRYVEERSGGISSTPMAKLEALWQEAKKKE